MFGILRCVGVTGGQLATLILAEAAVLGLIGSLLGLGLGVILGQGMVGPGHPDDQRPLFRCQRAERHRFRRSRWSRDWSLA